MRKPTSKESTRGWWLPVVLAAATVAVLYGLQIAFFPHVGAAGHLALAAGFFALGIVGPWLPGWWRKHEGWRLRLMRKGIRNPARLRRARAVVSPNARKLWVASTVLLCAAAALIAGSLAYNAVQNKVTSAIVFQEIANAGTFLAAAAAWFTATVARRSASVKSEKISESNSKEGGMSEGDYEFLRDYMSHVSAGSIEGPQAIMLMEMVKALKSVGQPIDPVGSAGSNGHIQLSKPDVHGGTSMHPAQPNGSPTS